MSELLDFYQQQAEAGVSTIPWLANLQKKGVQELAQFSFPSRDQEDWKYTNVEALLQQRFVEKNRGSTTDAAVKSDLPVSLSLMIKNGQVLNVDEFLKQMPAGVIVQPLTQAIIHHPDKVKPYLNQLLHAENGFHALNTALLACGVLIYLPAGVRMQEPIVISHWQDQPKQAVHSRHLIVAQAGSQATIVEEYHGAAESSYLTNTITEVFVAANACLDHYKIQRESGLAYHIGHLAVVQAQASEFNSHSFSFGGKLVRSDINLCFKEEHARCLMNGVYAPKEGQHVDHHTTVHHLVPNCQSEQDYKGILIGRSRAVFNGRIVVAKNAQHTKAQQQNKNLLLSPQSEIDTKPQLEIFADDVICSHGATVGQLDEEALFYLATRGIDRLEASRYLVHAFATDNLRLMSHKALADWMATLLNQQLE